MELLKDKQKTTKEILKNITVARIMEDQRKLHSVQKFFDNESTFHQFNDSSSVFHRFNDNNVVIPAVGDSMYPQISAGDIVSLKKVDNLEYIQYGEAHLVITDAETNNMRTIKILRKHPNDEMIILKPANPEFGEMVIPRKSIISIYIVKGSITRYQL